MASENWSKEIKALREKRGISLRELSRLAEISPASLSAIEKGRSSPTLATLHKILQALDTNFTAFFNNQNAQDYSPVFKTSQMRQLEDSFRKYQFLLPEKSIFRFEMVYETISSLEGESEWESHDCDMGGVLLKGGPLRLEIQGFGEWIIQPGDSFYVLAKKKHRAVNTSKSEDAQLITVFDPPRY
jgi:transcriptional regulator with XRE-family HTH domain